MLKKIILSILITSAICLSGCGNNSKTDTATPDSVSTIVTQSSNNTNSEENQIEQTILDSGLKIDKDGKITDSEGKEIKSEDGKIKITTEDGSTVEVETSQIEAVNNSSGKTDSSEKSNSSSSETSSKTENKTDKTTSAATSTNKNSSSNKGAASSKADTNKSNTSSSKNETSNANSSTSSNKNNSTSKPTSPNNTTSNKTWHEAEYKYVNHPAETKQVWVVDKEAYTYEEPVYEEQGRYICNECGADITYTIDDHIYNHMINKENGSYRVDVIDVQVGTRTVEVPEEGHWETVVVKEAWTEKILVREAGYY